MAVDVVDLLRELGFSIKPGTTPASWLLRSPDGRSIVSDVIAVDGRVTAVAARNATAHSGYRERLLFVGESATKGVVDRAHRGELDLLTETPLRLIVQGSVYSEGRSKLEATLRLAPGRTRHKAWVRWAVERCLLLSRESLHQYEIAELVGGTQQAVSNATRHLGRLVQVSSEGVEVTDRAALLELWKTDYSGPDGQEFGWYSLGSIVEQTAKAAEIAAAYEADPLISGDVAADRIAPWRLPVQGRIYLSSPVDLAGDGFVPTPLAEASLITCVPRDPTLWRLADLGFKPSVQDLPLADTAIVYRDVLLSGGTDSGEAAEQLAALIVRMES